MARQSLARFSICAAALLLCHCSLAKVRHPSHLLQQRPCIQAFEPLTRCQCDPLAVAGRRRC